MKKNIPSTILYEDNEIIAFQDINPVAPIHILIVPTHHFPDLGSLPEKDMPLTGRMLHVATELARERGLDGKGYRVVINNGKDGGQLVMHLHMHLIGGKPLGHKMG